MAISAAEMSGTNERRIRVIGNRVACSRIGVVALERCRECDYLLRLDEVSEPRKPQKYVVCAEVAQDAETDFAW